MINDTLRTIEPPVRIRERAVAQLRDAIIRGELKPGTRLIERELYEALGISRASIREVIRSLEAEKLVEVGQRGATVAQLTRKQALEIYEMRAQLEAMLVRRFTEVASAAQIDQLWGIFREIEESAADEDIPALIALMMRFNNHLIAVVDHEVIRDILGHLLARISWLRATSMSRPGRIATSVGEIHAIVQAIADRDSDAAARNVITYVNNARDAALERLEDPTL